MTLLSNKGRIRRILREDLSEEERLLPPEVQDQLIEDRVAYEEYIGGAEPERQTPENIVTDEETGKVWDTTNPREPQEVSVTQTVSGLDLAAQDVFKKLYPEQKDGEKLLRQAQVTPESFLQDLGKRGTSQDRELMLRAMGASDQDVQEIFPAWEREVKLETLTQKVFPKYTLDDLAEFIEQEPDEFVKAIKLGGMTAEKQELLAGLGLSETEIDDMFMEQFVKTGAEWFKEFNPDRGEDIGAAGRLPAEKTAKAFTAGVGDMIAGAGGAARWLGFKDVGDNLTRYGAGLQAQAPERPAKEFEFTDLLNPDYWDSQITRQLPFALSMMPVALVGYTGGGAVAAAMGLGKVFQMVFGGLTSAALTRPMESAVEAGQSFDDAISRGKTEAEAKKQADEVFKKNMLLGGADAFEIATALAPTPKWVPKSLVSSGLARVVRFAGKTLIVGLSEGGEELFQDMFQRHARGEEWKLDPVSKEVFAMGAVLGMGMGMGGDVVTDVVARTQEQMTGSMKSTFKQAVRQLVSEGFARDEAELRAMDAIAQSPEGESLLKKVISEVKEIHESEVGAVELPTPEPGMPEAGVPTGEVTKVTPKEPWMMTRKEYVERGAEGIPVSGRKPEDLKLLADTKTNPDKYLFHATPSADDAISIEHYGLEAGGLSGRPESGYAQSPDGYILVFKRSDIPKGMDTADVSLVKGYKPIKPIGVFKQREYGGHIEYNARMQELGDLPQPPDTIHYEEIKQALSEGKPVPPEVLKDYPDLAKPSGVTPEIPKAETPKVEAPTLEKITPEAPKVEAKVAGGEPPAYKTREEIANMTEEELARHEKSLGVEPPPPEKPAQSVSVPEPPAQPKEIDRVIDLATEQVKQDRPGRVTRFFHAIPGIRQLMEFERPGLKMTGENEDVLTALVAERQAKSMMGTTSLGTQIDLLNQLRKAFGKDALHGGKVEIEVKDGQYVLTERQKGVLAFMESRNDNLLEVVVNDYGAEIGRFTPQTSMPVDVASPIAFTLKDIADHNGVYLPNVDVGEDVIEYLGSETRAAASGRGKSRIWQTAQERMAGKTKFTPQLDVEKLIEGLDAFKASAAGGQTFRQVIGGLTRLEAMKETHPALYDKMEALRKRINSLQGSAGTIESNVHTAIFDFLNSPVEDEDLSNLRDALDVKLKTGIRKGMDMAAVQDEMVDVRAEIQKLRPAWNAANLKPYVFIQEGIFRYFPADKAKLIKETRLISKNPILTFIERWRGGAFSGDVSPFAIQGSVGVLADPWGSLKVGVGATKSAIQHHDLLRSFSLSALADDIGNNITDWGEYAALMGRDLSGTPTEYAAGFLSKIPGFDKFTESTYITVTRQSFALWQRTYKEMIKHGVPEVTAKVAAADVSGEVYPLVNTTRLGQSQARTAFLRALPTSYSFIRQPFTLIGQASTGFAKMVTLQKLTPKESYSVKMITTMASSIMIASATSAALSAIARGEDEDEVRKAIWDAINPHPYNGNFASIIIGDKRIPLGGPFRAIFRAIYPADVKGVPFPVPFYGMLHYNTARGKPEGYLVNRISPALRAQLELFAWNQDYGGNPILKGNAPEQFIRGLLYELESALPLTAGEVADKLRRGEKYTEDLLQQVIAQFMGVNMATMDNTYMDRQMRKLGLPEETSEGKPFSIQQPDLYLTKDFWGDANRVLSSRKREGGKEEGYDDDPKVKAIIEARAIKEQMESLANEKAVKVNADVTKGDTFIEYFEQWQQRQKIKDETALAEFDQKYPKAYLGNMSQNTYVLLQKYHSMTDKKAQEQFLEKHPELDLNPRQEWLRAHQEDNAKLAIWGQAKILTEAAYNKARALVKSLDIPEDALDKFLPPSDLAKPMFDFQDTAEKWGSNSWEAKLALTKNDDLRKYLEREPVDTPVKSLELKVKNRALFDKLDAFSDKESAGYISDDKKREETVKELKKGNPAFVDDLRRIEAIEKGGDAVIEKHVKYGQMIDKDEVAASSAEAMLYRVDNPDYEKWRTDEKVWEKQALKPVDTSRVPVWRIDVKYRKEDAEYNDLPETPSIRQAYLQKHEAYRKDRRRREAYEMVNSVTGEKFPQTEVENFVNYYEIPTKGFRQERFLVENPEFGKAMHAIKGNDLPDPKKVPVVAYDNLYDQYQKDFDKLWSLSDHESPNYIENEKAREKARDTMLGGGKGRALTEFGIAKIRLDAYSKFVPESRVNDYVGYYTLISQGKHENYEIINKTDQWYDDDWFLMEHMDFYKEVYLGILGNQRRDFRKVPSRPVFQKYTRYLRLLPGEAREDYRRSNRDLDEWLVIKFNFKPIKELAVKNAPKESKVAADLQRARAIR